MPRCYAKVFKPLTFYKNAGTVKPKYSKEHTWLLVEGNVGTIGITDFAQSELGEIVYADLPNLQYSFKQNEIFGSVEAIKTASDLFMPVSGKVIDVNKMLPDEATLINTNPFGEGWMVNIDIQSRQETGLLLSKTQYNSLVSL